MLADQNKDLNKYLTIQQLPNISGYVWKVDGQFRTVTSELPMDSEGNSLVLGVQYAIENKSGRTFSGNCVGCTIYISAPGEDNVEIANPAVSITGIEESSMSIDVIDLPDFKSTELPTIESSSQYPLFSEWIKPNENALLNTTSLEDGMTCDSSDFRMPMEWDGDGAPGNTQPGTFGSIFAKSLDSETGSEVVFLYDRHLSLLRILWKIRSPMAAGSLSSTPPLHPQVTRSSATMSHATSTTKNTAHYPTSPRPAHQTPSPRKSLY
mmetsp:Transcript_598/g.1176  ORF Transcript_598/g.1176 Transcript_598/m.1176 type:complete len:266 (+) Transcript_598:668-1465(+)